MNAVLNIRPQIYAHPPPKVIPVQFVPVQAIPVHVIPVGNKQHGRYPGYGVQQQNIVIPRDRQGRHGQKENSPSKGAKSEWSMAEPETKKTRETRIERKERR